MACGVVLHEAACGWGSSGWVGVRRAAIYFSLDVLAGGAEFWHNTFTYRSAPGYRTHGMDSRSGAVRARYTTYIGEPSHMETATISDGYI